MPTITTSWIGQCKDRNVRDKLLGYIEKIAKLGHSYYEKSPDMICFNVSVIEGRLRLDPELIKLAISSIPQGLEEKEVSDP